MYGSRARLGLIIPSSTTSEPEYTGAVPEDASVHVARMRLEDTATAETLREMLDSVERCGSLLATANVDAIGFACTVGSLLDGPETATDIERQLSRLTDGPAVATAAAVDRALETLGVHTVAVATPYIDDLNDLERAFLEACGYEVTAIDGLGLESDLAMGAQPPSRAARQARAVDTPDADCVFISCTNYRTFEIIDDLEADLGKPVVSSNQATLWNLLEVAGVEHDRPSLGTLFDRSL
ncbi:maleate cis-trans isomerase family protein [Natrononativus amylolyticus]|uniref:maleate cis-trans isomerase family protein n=1 Tax=Natrononativus amylolyticus TaxID=2963434 RepID=UPI0020CCB2B2|nr:aspartate/glutamate racemase family protein [Natrononativus amylolyticus]